jgi:hypothetical protein
VHWLLVTANIDPSSPILVTLMMEVLCSSETSVLTTATWCNIPEDAILHSHQNENLKSYNPLFQYSGQQTTSSDCYDLDTFLLAFKPVNFSA